MFVTSGSPSRSSAWLSFFFFNDTATTEIYTLSLHDALPISFRSVDLRHLQHARRGRGAAPDAERSEPPAAQDRKSTRLNSSHSQISYAVFCLKKKNHNQLHWEHLHYVKLRHPHSATIPLRAG